MDNKTDTIAVISDFSTEYTTAHYFVEALQLLGIPVVTFDPGQQRQIPQEITTRLYIDSGDDYCIYPAQNTLKILYIIDTHTRPDSGKNFSQFADVVFCAQKNAVDTLKQSKPHVYWMPLACSPQWHCDDAAVKQYDLAFVGGINDPRRAASLQLLQDKYADRCYIGRAPKADIGRIYSSARIVFNIAIKNDINMRFFEGLCSGALLVTEQIVDNGMEDLTQPDHQYCVFYDTFEDAVQKIDYYLNHEAERKELAGRGQAFAMSNTYDARMRTMIEVATKITPSKRSSLCQYHIQTLCDDVRAGGLKYAIKNKITYIKERLCS